ncbi:hypothetical protein V6N11_055346 [Hibiscus sabdariffa]|uniref:RRM domain-containing protein n=2 Tax=Hibiscus sabdariffa TaxID=183260 RepID=A0ABR2PF23_9ROSI
MDRSSVAAKEEGVTLFVSNLPEKLHWKGLWALFSYHGDVLDLTFRVREVREVKESTWLDLNLAANMEKQGALEESEHRVKERAGDGKNRNSAKRGRSSRSGKE